MATRNLLRANQAMRSAEKAQKQGNELLKCVATIVLYILSLLYILSFQSTISSCQSIIISFQRITRNCSQAVCYILNAFEAT